MPLDLAQYILAQMAARLASFTPGTGSQRRSLVGTATPNPGFAFADVDLSCVTSEYGGETVGGCLVGSKTFLSAAHINSSGSLTAPTFINPSGTVYNPTRAGWVGISPTDVAVASLSAAANASLKRAKLMPARLRDYITLGTFNPLPVVFSAGDGLYYVGALTSFSPYSITAVDGGGNPSQYGPCYQIHALAGFEAWFPTTPVPHGSGYPVGVIIDGEFVALYEITLGILTGHTFTDNTVSIQSAMTNAPLATGDTLAYYDLSRFAVMPLNYSVNLAALVTGAANAAGNAGYHFVTDGSNTIANVVHGVGMVSDPSGYMTASQTFYLAAMAQSKLTRVSATIFLPAAGASDRTIASQINLLFGDIIGQTPGLLAILQIFRGDSGDGPPAVDHVEIAPPDGLAGFYTPLTWGASHTVGMDIHPNGAIDVLLDGVVVYTTAAGVISWGSIPKYAGLGFLGAAGDTVPLSASALSVIQPAAAVGGIGPGGSLGLGLGIE